MEKRPLGASGLRISPLVFGGNVFGWTADEATSFALLDAFLDAGFETIDTADGYSVWVPGHDGGESETLIGKWMAARGNRDRVIVATKVGWDVGANGKGLSRSHIVTAVERSLKRLQTDRIDLYQSHVDDASVPFEETLEAHAALIKAGKVRAIGASNTSGARLKEALAAADRLGVPRYTSLQPKYNLYDREPFESDLRDLCVAENVGVISFYGLAAGFLTGKYRSKADGGKSPRGARVVESYVNPRGLRIVAALDEVAAGIGATPAQVALAWLLTRPGVTAPIVSASTVAQLQEIAKAPSIRLDRAALDALEAASAA